MAKIFEGRIDSTPNTHTKKKQVQDKGNITSNVYFQDDNNNNKNTVALGRKKDRKEHDKV